MKKFTDIRKVGKIVEQEINLEKPEEVIAIGASASEVVVETPIETPVETTVVEPVTSNDAVKLFSKLFESREMAHIYHLQVNGEQGSHAAHTALDTYYNDVLVLIDDLIETYQGQYGIADGYHIIDTNGTKTNDKIEYFEGVVEFIKHGRQAIVIEDSHLHNIVDEIVALLYKTLYKLKFTK